MALVLHLYLARRHYGACPRSKSRTLMTRIPSARAQFTRHGRLSKEFDPPPGEQIEAAFDRFDTDGSGAISPKELKSALSELQIKISTKMLAELWRAHLWCGPTSAVASSQTQSWKTLGPAVCEPVT